MWNNFQTDAYEGMIAETTGITGHGGKPIHAYYARPIGEGPFPGILLIHHMPGWDQFTRETARRFAAQGYSVIAPNLYEDFGHGTPEEVVERAQEKGGMADKDVMEDCGGALNFLRSQPGASGKVGVIGMCSGGRHTFLAACTLDGIDCAVDCWGGGVVCPPEQLTPWPPLSTPKGFPARCWASSATTTGAPPGRTWTSWRRGLKSWARTMSSTDTTARPTASGTTTGPCTGTSRPWTRWRRCWPSSKST